MLGSAAVSGASQLSQQPDSLSLAWYTSAGVELTTPDASPASPRLFDSPVLPQTPPSQMLRAASGPPPVRRLRNTASPPPASHPTLSSAMTVACTLAPDSCPSPRRLPTQRQLGFSFRNTSAPPESPFAAAAASTEAPTLLDKINSLPGPTNVLRTVLTQNKNRLSVQDSGTLTHMLHRATLLQTATECCGSGSSFAGSACSFPGMSNDGASLSLVECPRPSAPAKAQRAPPPPQPTFQPSAASTNSYLTTDRSAFSKNAMKRRGPVVTIKPVGAQTPHSDGVLLQHAATMPLLPLPDSFFGSPAPRCDATQLAPLVLDTGAVGAGESHCCHLRAAPGSPADNGLCSRAPSGVSDIRHTDRVANADSQGHYTSQLPEAVTISPSSSRPWAWNVGQNLPAQTVGIGVTLNLNNDPEKVPNYPGTCVFLPNHPNESNTHNLESRTTPGSKPMSSSCSTPAHKAVGNSLKHGPVASGLECRLMLPHGTRGHKRPRLEDKLKERLLKAELGQWGPSGSTPRKGLHGRTA